jgi:hypothetical protein
MLIQSLISKIWDKQGIKSINDLSIPEKQEYDRWQQIMEGSDVTVDKLKDFCISQIKLIEGKYASGDNTDKQDMFLRASLHIYLNLIKLIDAPEIDRKNLEYYLITLINK